MLERRYPHKWGKKDHIRQEISGPDSAPIQQEIKSEISASELLQQYKHLWEDDSPT